MSVRPSQISLKENINHRKALGLEELKYIARRIDIPLQMTSFGLLPVRNQLIGGTRAGIIFKYDINSEEILDRKEIKGEIWDLVVTSDESFIFLGGTAGILFKLNLENLEIISEFIGHQGEINCCKLSIDQKYIYSGSDDSKIIKWEIITGRNVGIFNLPNIIYCIDINIEDTLLATGGAWGLTLFKISDNLSNKESIFVENAIWAVLISIDSKFIFAGCQDSNIYKFKTEDRTFLEVFSGHSDRVRSLNFINQNFIVSTGIDFKIIVWDVANKLIMADFNIHSDWARKSIYNSITNQIYTISDDKTLSIISFDPGYFTCFKTDINFSKTFPILSLKNYKIVQTNTDILIVSQDLSTIFSRILIGNCVFLDMLASNNQLIIVYQSDWVINTSKFTIENLIVLKHIELDVQIAIGSVSKIDLKTEKLESGLKNNDTKKFDKLKIIDSIHSILILKEKKEILELNFDSLQYRTILIIEKSIEVLFITENWFYVITTDELMIFSSETLTIQNTFKQEQLQFIVTNISLIKLSPDKKFTFLVFEQELIVYTSETWQKLKIINVKNCRCIEFSADQNYFICLTSENLLYIDQDNFELKFVYQLWVDNDTQISLNTEEKSLLIVNNGFASILKNVSKQEKFGAYYFYQNKFSILLNFITNQKSEHYKEMGGFVISNLNLNTLHFLVFWNKIDEIKLALQSGVPFSPDNLGLTPLDYAIELKQYEAATVIIDSLVEKSKSDRYALKNLSNSLLRINQSNLESISQIYEAGILEIDALKLPKFCGKSVKLPSLIKSDYENFNLLEFKYNNFEAEEVSIKFAESAFKIDFNLEYLKSLLKIEDLNIFRVPLIQMILRNEFQSHLTIIYLQTFICWTQFIFLIVLLFEFNITLLVFCLLLNTLLALSEVIQMVSSPSLYFLDLWNILDCSRALSVSIWVILRLNHTNSEYAQWIMILLNFCKGFTGFRAFDSTRYYIRLIYECFNKIKGFLTIFIYTTICFGILNTSTNQNLENLTFEGFWGNSYALVLGDISSEFYSDTFNLLYVTFFMASFLNVIMMLNLIISILGDAFDDFQIMAEVHDHKELCEVLLEIEQIKSVIWKNHSKSSFIRVCVTDKESKSRIWKGKVIEFKELLESSISKVLKKISEIDTETKIIQNNSNNLEINVQNNINNIEVKIKAEIKTLEEKIEAKINTLEGKIDTLLSRI